MYFLCHTSFWHFLLASWGRGLSDVLLCFLMMKLKHPRLSTHFSLSCWLCQALTLLGLVSLPIMKLFNHPRLLITHMYELKIHLTHILHFLHSNCTIPLLTHWRSLTLQALVHDTSYLCFFHLLACLSQECDFASNLHVVSHNTMIILSTFRHAHALTYVLWSVVVFTVISFLYASQHNWVSYRPSFHSNGSTNAPVTALEVSLHMIRPMHR